LNATVLTCVNKADLRPTNKIKSSNLASNGKK
jgi:hypothetical protein